MNQIFKHPLEIKHLQIISVTQDAQILDCQFQDGQLVLWEIHDNTRNALTNRKIMLCGTGEPFKQSSAERLKHIATVQDKEIGCVWHLFECVSVLD